MQAAVVQYKAFSLHALEISELVATKTDVLGSEMSAANSVSKNSAVERALSALFFFSHSVSSDACIPSYSHLSWLIVLFKFGFLSEL